MNRSQAALLLTACAARDRRTIGDADVLAWHEDLHDLDFEDARKAVSMHYRESVAFMMPAHVRQRVREIRETAIREWLTKARTQPECEHGFAGGNLVRPDTNAPLCALCRRALPQ